MNYMFKLAFKNVLRSKRRIILTFLIMSFGIAIYILMAGMLKGFDDASIKNIIDFDTGHYKLRSIAFDEDRPFDTANYLDNVLDLKAKLSKLSFITGITERVNFLAELDNSIDASSVVCVGIGPQDNKVFSLAEYISEGELQAEGVILGKNLAEGMGLKLGDMVYLTFRNKQGMLTSMERVITGIVNSADPRVNNSSVFMPLAAAKQYLNTEQVTEIAVKTDSANQISKYEPEINKALEGLAKVYSWKKLSQDFVAITAMKKKSSSVFLLMITIIAMVGIINTLLMSVYEKKREIGTMKALGMTDKEVRTLFLMEGLLIGVAGGILGLILGTLFNGYFVIQGLDITAMVGEETKDIGYPVMGVVKSAWDYSAYIGALLLSVLASLLASYYPARKVTKLQPMECLRTIQ